MGDSGDKQVDIVKRLCFNLYVIKRYTLYTCTMNIITETVSVKLAMLSKTLTRVSSQDEHWSSGPRPVKLCSDQ
jgi:hypothetical protein